MKSNLWQLKKGQCGEVTALDEQLCENYRKRLVELGFAPGANVQCLVAPRLGAPKLYQVRNTVYSLERSVALQVLIRERDS